MGNYHLSKGTLELYFKESNIDLCDELEQPICQ